MNNDSKYRGKINVELTEKAYEFINEKKSAVKNNLMNRFSSLEEEDLIKLVSIINDVN